MQAFPIRFRVHGDRSDTESARRPDDTTGDFTPICNEYLVEHAKAADFRACAMDFPASCLRAWQANGKFAAASYSAG
jgi:hypothetical protein